jgi:hypothetical protein
MKTKGCHCEARSAVAISVGLWRNASFPLTPVCRDCFAEFTLSQILRSLHSLRMTEGEGLAMTG